MVSTNYRFLFITDEIENGNKEISEINLSKKRNINFKIFKFIS